MKKNSKKILISIVLFLIFVIYTLVVKYIDVKPIGPEGSEVGISTLNNKVHNLIGVNMFWYNVTGYLGLLPFILVAFYGLVGLVQLISRKRIMKVDKKILTLGVFYIILAIIYVFFEKIIINYRPTLIEGSLEASYPSSHTMLAIFVCGSSILLSRYFIRNTLTLKWVNVITIIVMISLVLGRIISGVHWISDIIGGIIISVFLLYTLKTVISNFEISNENGK